MLSPLRFIVQIMSDYMSKKYNESIRCTVCTVL